MLERCRLYFDTVKYLKVEQIFYRLKLKFKKKQVIYNNNNIYYLPNLYIEGLDNSPNYLRRFNLDEIMSNKITLLNESHLLSLNSWEIDGTTTHLWLYNLQYMEWLIPIAIKYRDTGEEKYYKKIVSVIKSWINAHKSQNGDAWAPYVISMRLINWIIIINLIEKNIKNDNELWRLTQDSIYNQYKHLSNNEEKHLLGNHLFENLKCLVICSCMFQEIHKKNTYKKALKSQINEQIMPDGMHYERSFMYHKIILEDMLRVYNAICQIDNDEEYLIFLKEKIRKMGEVNEFELEFKRTLHFNDAGDNVSKSAFDIGNIMLNMKMNQKNVDVKKLDCAGYYKYHLNNVTIVIDCGEIAPRYISGHGHCDCLSYEIFINGYPLIVNSGTYQYQDAKRTYFRSTRAHNTFMINDNEQSECWAEHRVGRRIRNIRADYGTNKFVGEYVDQAGNFARREFIIYEDAIQINDCSIKRKGTIKSYIHFNPKCCIMCISESEYHVRLLDENIDLQVTILSGKTKFLQNEFWYSEEFGSCSPINAIEVTGKNEENVSYKIQWKEKSDG